MTGPTGEANFILVRTLKLEIKEEKVKIGVH